MVKGRALKVRFAPLDSTIKVKNLTPWISNELLEKAFSVFGEVERAIVIVDKKGKSSGEGIIEFSKKNSAQLALRKCTEGCYRLTAYVSNISKNSKSLLTQRHACLMYFPYQQVPKY